MSDRPVTTVMPLPDYARVSREEKQLLVEKRGGVATSTNKQLIQQLEELDETAPIADLDLEDLSSQFTIPALKAILKANGQRFGSKDKKSILADLVIDLSNSSKVRSLTGAVRYCSLTCWEDPASSQGRSACISEQVATMARHPAHFL